MAYLEQDNKPDKITSTDRGEYTAVMEPILVRQDAKSRAQLSDLALELTEKSTGLSRSLPPAIVRALSDLVRAMNCYCSNLIEGHDTHPVDIERALNEDFSDNPEQRDLQLVSESSYYCAAMDRCRKP